jgi:hypothetical protein
LAVASELILVLGALLIFWSTFSIPLNQMFPAQTDWPKFWTGLGMVALSAIGFLAFLLSTRAYVPPSEAVKV